MCFFDCAKSIIVSWTCHKVVCFPHDRLTQRGLFSLITNSKVVHNLIWSCSKENKETMLGTGSADQPNLSICMIDSSTQTSNVEFGWLANRDYKQGIRMSLTRKWTMSALGASLVPLMLVWKAWKPWRSDVFFRISLVLMCNWKKSGLLATSLSLWVC